jgi:hypothetical protein
MGVSCRPELRYYVAGLIYIRHADEDRYPVENFSDVGLDPGISHYDIM